MKRFGYLFEKIVDIENIKLAHKNARRGKSRYREVKMVDADIERYALEIKQLLESGLYRTSEYSVIQKIDKGKVRDIYRLPYYPDRIVHHAIMQVLEPIWKPTLINDTYQSIKGRGPHKAIKKLRRLIIRDGYRYYLKLDLAKYYPSIDNAILKLVIRKKIKCSKTLELLDSIVDSCVGVPIGNYLSQYLGNIYLNELDQIGVRQGCKYFRYCDDIVAVADTKDKLWKLLKLVVAITASYKLKIKWYYVVAVQRRSKLDYLGYCVHSDRTLLRKSIKLRSKTSRIRALHSYIGWLRHCNGWNLTNKLRSVYGSTK